MRTLIYTLSLLFLALGFIAIGANLFPVVREKVIYTDRITTVSPTLNKQNLKQAISLLNMKCPQIVEKQAYLESTHLTDKRAIECQNIFGLCKNNKLIRFNHWFESLCLYKYLFNDCFKGGSEREYVRYLEGKGYFEDKFYAKKLKGIRL
jgi:hypothetical protein